jgi:hypothetical protein
MTVLRLERSRAHDRVPRKKALDGGNAIGYATRFSCRGAVNTSNHSAAESFNSQPEESIPIKSAPHSPKDNAEDQSGGLRSTAALLEGRRPWNVEWSFTFEMVQVSNNISG